MESNQEMNFRDVNEDFLESVSRGNCHWNIYYDTKDKFRAYKCSVTNVLCDVMGVGLVDVIDYAIAYKNEVFERCGEQPVAFSVTKKWAKSKRFSRVAYCDLDENNFLNVPPKGFGKGYETGLVFKNCQVEYKNFYKIIDSENGEILRNCMTLADAKIDASVIFDRTKKWILIK